MALRIAAATALFVTLLGASLPTATAPTTCPGDTTPDFTDDCYHEYILYKVDQANVDILILPSSSPYALRDSVLMKQSAQQWDAGINSLAPSWLANGLNLRPYRVGQDTTPNSALWDPEVVIIPAEFNPVLLFGIGLQSPASWCHGIPPPIASWDTMVDGITSHARFHRHGDAGMLSVACSNGGRICFVVNTNFLWLPDAQNRRDMYDLNSHELGHCLGIGHVGDALDFSASSYPSQDIMSYQSGSHVHCVSTLNILALQQVYGDLLGQSGYPTNPAGGYVHQDPASWSAYSCPEPTAGLTG